MIYARIITNKYHYGNVEIINNNDTYVEYNIDGIKVKIDKIKLNK